MTRGRGCWARAASCTVSSQPGRTSPVQRGKWVLQKMLGVNPPDPPPNVPDLPPAANDPGETRGSPRCVNGWNSTAEITKTTLTQIGKPPPLAVRRAEVRPLVFV